jgi:hypothetical protein
MEEFKLYKIYHLGANPCWDLKVARSAEEALTQCFEHRRFPRPDSAIDSSCRAEEVMVQGFKIKIEKI